MKGDLFLDSSCPICKNSANLERVEPVETEDVIAWLVRCKDCKAEFFILTHVFGWSFQLRGET